MTNVDTVFFDVGNTLLFPNRELILAPLREQGEDPSLELWHAIERRTKKEFDTEMKEGRADHSFWYLFYGHLLDDLKIDDAELHEKLVAATRISANWGNIVPGTRDILDRIGARYRIGVISNADGKIEDLLSVNGIADCFRTITDSGLVGYEKPHPAIFEAALQQMKATPERCLYVGDLYSVDYAGATQAGMQGTMLDVAGAYRENGVPRVQSLAELERVLLD